MKIIDINGKKREVAHVKQVTQLIPDSKGGFVPHVYVEAIMVGRCGRTWKEWYPIKAFKVMNPTVKVK